MANTNPYHDPHHRQALRDTVQRITRTLHELTDLFQTFYELFDEDVDRQTSAERHATLFSVDFFQTFYELFDQDVDRQTSAERHNTLFSVDFTAAEDPVPATTGHKRTLPSRDDVPNARRAWTFQDEEDLAAAVHLALDRAWMCTKFGRTAKAIEHKLAELRTAGRL